MMNFKKDVVYYFDEMIGTYHYAYAHPMKPLRVAMTDEIVRKYQLDQHFDTIVNKLTFRTYNSQRYTSIMQIKSHSPPSTQINTSTLSKQSPRKTEETLKINSIASTSKRTALSCSASTIIASATPQDQSVHLFEYSHCSPSRLRQIQLRNQLVRRPPSRQTV
jgi:hypothetical protein